MVDRLVVVGGNAAGMTAASQARKRRGDDLEVIALERSSHASYSSCGIPYWVAGDVADSADLEARSPEQHRSNGIDLRLHAEVTGLDLDSRRVSVREPGRAYDLGFDEVVIATGAQPARPQLPGIDALGIFGVQTLDDGAALLDRLQALRGRPRHAVVVGAGYIGVEMAEALVRCGLAVTVLDRAPEPMTTLDPDMGALVHRQMEAEGIEVRPGVTVDGFEAGPDGWVRAVVAGQESYPADLVVLGLGVRPDTALAAGAGLALGPSGGLRTDLRMCVQEGVWAGGDCVEVRDLVSEDFVHVPLGTHANKHGRVIGTNVGGGYATFPGVVRTAVSKVCKLEIARTGLLEREAERIGFRYVAVRVESTTTAGYMPSAAPLTIKMLAEVGSGRLLGVQIVGEAGAGKRIDACAVALWNRMTVEEMTGLDLAYAPPYAPVWDPVLIAARKATDALAHRG